MAIIEREGCFFDGELLQKSSGFESLDPTGQEAFVNHMHLIGDNRVLAAAKTIESWIAEMRSRWPTQRFRIYKFIDAHEIIIRFHLVRPGVPNWCEEGLEIITIGDVNQ